MQVLPTIAIVGLFACADALCLAADQADRTESDNAIRSQLEAISKSYSKTHALVSQFCLECHSTADKQGDLDIERFATIAEVRRDSDAWQKIEQMVGSGEMPPEDAEQPTDDQRGQLLSWVRDYLNVEAQLRAGDPGPVVLRRLNNAEYTYTIRDLTRIDLNPAREFPVDSASGEGFTNTGNSLVMSPALLAKYLDAGKEIARHAVLTPDGFRFSASTTRRDWTDEILAQLREFYRQFVDTADLGTGAAVGNINLHGDTRFGQAGRLPLEKYLAATITHRDALSAGGESFEAVARECNLNAKYLAILWSSLSGDTPSLLIDHLRSQWRAASAQDAARLTAEVVAWQRGLWRFNPVGLVGRRDGPSRWMEPVSPLVTQQDIRFQIPVPAEGDKASEVVFSLVVTDAGDGNQNDFVVWQRPRLIAEGKPEILLRDIGQDSNASVFIQSASASADAQKRCLVPATFGKHPNGVDIDDASLCVRAPTVIEIRLPADLAAGRELVATAALEEQSAAEGSVQVDVVNGVSDCPSGLMPSEVVITFSQVTQVFADRRDLAFRRPILVRENSAAQKRFEAAMEDHRRVFPAALCYTQIVPVDEVLTLTLFHREDEHLTRLMLDEAQHARLNRLWGELHFVSQSALLHLTAIEMLLETYLGNGLTDRSQYETVEPLHKPYQARAAAFKQELIDSEPRQLDALITFASQAYRRPLTDLQSNELRELYRRLRSQELPHEEAFRLTLARIFVASPFLFRLEKSPDAAAAAAVSDWELASRLSYFVWSSMPDDELRRTAADGTLHTPEQLSKHTFRMLQDDRVRRLATEFACQWLHIYDFDSVEVKSPDHFPEFLDLRGDMYEEAILFFTDLFQRDGTLLSLLDADHTFVNERLANFYGVEGVAGNAWHRVTGIRQHGRGGILGLAATLGKQSGASRTSPILRGNWVSEVLLGEKLPRPPKNVPQLADTVPEGLTERQLIERHSSDLACAKCHQRIDPIGFALEGFDAIGRRRNRDAAGLPINTRTTLPDGSEIEGLDGLRDYLIKTRRDAIVDQFCRKLLGYALGREMQLSDQPLLTEMKQQLANDGYRVSTAVEMIVQSPQFRQIRGRDIQLAESP